jgi:hypothetical protein
MEKKRNIQATRNEKACAAWRIKAFVEGEGHLLMRWTGAGSLIVETNCQAAPTYRLRGSVPNKPIKAISEFLGLSVKDIPLLIGTRFVCKVFEIGQSEIWRYNGPMHHEFGAREVLEHIELCVP